MGELYTAPAFTGWLRTPGQPWRAVAEGQTDPECFRRLMAASQGYQHSELYVLPRGRHPDESSYRARERARRAKR